MKDTYKLVALFLIGILGFTSCQKEDEIADDQKVRAVSWAISEEHKDTLEISINDYISFMDASQGVLFHEWTIGEESNYLTGDFSKGEEDFTPFIDTSKGLKTEDATVHVYFPNAGVHQVKLYNSYDKKVTHNGALRKLEAVEMADQPGIWVIDTTFNVEVYANVQPAFYVLKNHTDTVLFVSADQEVDGADDSEWPTLDLIASEDVLTFVDTTTVGKPTDTEWTLSYLEETSKERAFEVVPMKTGQGRAGAMKSIRQGSSQALSQTVQKTIPLKLNIKAPEVRPQYEVYKGETLLFAYNDGDEIPSNPADWTKISIKVNESLTFVDNTERGLTNEKVWTLNNTVEETYTTESAEAQYPTIAMAFEAGTFKSIRKGVAGMPDAEVEVKIPLLISVDEALLKTSALIEGSSKIISFETSIQVTSVGADATSHFTAHITNPNGYNSPSSISAIAIDPNNSQIIFLTVGETTYNSDEITIAYDGMGDIVSASGNQLEAFEEEKVVMYNLSENEFEDPDMISVELETTSLGNANALGWYQDGGQETEKKKWLRSTTYASHGDASMSFISDDRTIETSTLFSIHNIHAGKTWANGMKNPPGDYLLTFDIFIPEGVAFTSGLITGFQDTSLEGGDKSEYTPDLSNVEKGKWVTIKQIVSFDQQGARRQLVLKVVDPVPATGALEFYLDNFSCISIEARP
ncbi:hypothetical protein [Flammeovirga aprica]|uniref:PKD domain-containing protein n=1 Tax=Flammeovirga aprica JL-4 TaxID=694437 RepID=A0A7X9X9Q0_9BACT|nr:hypothetical protein [Flammeovirga aprica]NME68981.1 hypothetical protein [Flammeovirga aprica JL-4]